LRRLTGLNSCQDKQAMKEAAYVIPAKGLTSPPLADAAHGNNEHWSGKDI